jgi:3-hydroxy-9,10-secoandrosta-1,3,5(10)-triene-9,17-dione monooxygenase
MASGTAHQVDGGYSVKGTWDYASGCDLGTHFLGMTLVFPSGSETPAGTAWVLFDRSECQIINNWSVFRLQGTGSSRVEIGEHFVPAHRVAPWTDMQGRPSVRQPDPDIHVSPLFHGGVLPVLISELASVAVGAARGALDLYEISLRNKRRSFPPFDTLGELPEFQQHFGEAQSLIDTAESALLGMGSDYMDRARHARDLGAPLPEEAQRRMLMIQQQCARLVWDAVELMFRTGGSASAGKSSPLGRCFRNMAVLRTHITMQIDHTSINVARLHFGAAPLGPF